MLVATALLLILLAILADLGRTHPTILAVALIMAAFVGTTLPDLDLSLGLGHRSGVTHSLLPAALAATRRRWRAVAAGLALGLALHLAADTFPNAMRGYARVVLPFAGRLGAGESYAWLGTNAALALGLGLWLVRLSQPPRQALAALAATAVVGLAYLFRTDGGWWVLGLLALAAIAASAATRKR